jgi:site-specific recombinase XerD
MESQKNRSPIPHRKRGAITIEDAIAAFMASRSNRGIAVPTLNKYRTFVKQLRAYCDSRGYVLLDQLGVADMDRFYASWKDGNRSRAKKLERLKSFIKFCLKRKWLAEDIADDLRAPEGSSIPANKKPFTDEEFDRIYAACDTLGGPKRPAPVSPWGGQDVKDFVMAVDLYRSSDCGCRDFQY